MAGMKAHDDSGRRKGFLLSLGLTFLTFLFELIGGLWTGSLALLSDSAHVLLDVFALGISYLAIRAAARPADDTHSYGFHRLEVLAALINGLTLLAVSSGIFYEAWRRWSGPTDIKAGGMLGIAAAGLVVNLVVARVLHGHEHGDGPGHSSEGACPSGTETVPARQRD
jgi:Co/Zn/Cd efflux system component